jgi:hypothetical protein
MHSIPQRWDVNVTGQRLDDASCADACAVILVCVAEAKEKGRKVPPFCGEAVL